MLTSQPVLARGRGARNQGQKNGAKIRPFAREKRKYRTTYLRRNSVSETVGGNKVGKDDRSMS